ncbi:MAG: AraC family transcriptional regulator [Caulobacterales bacterium]|nr:AraC family transcriptional regulator [Caulobacterales bacterium]MCA0373434.1 AraC family transcriptional regulator [Pseudomonadota bacterium]
MHLNNEAHQASIMQCPRNEFHLIERASNNINHSGFSPHRHDTYTVALTTRGTQTFNYRGALRRSLPGQALILHPDELHDGKPCDEAGFGYCVAYIPPSHIQTILGCVDLPFVAEAVSSDAALVAAVARVVAPGCADDANDYQDAIFELACAIERVSGLRRPRHRPDIKAVLTAQQYLDELPEGGTHLEQMENITGRDRWNLCRDFRRILGTSPYRYLQYRRIAHAKKLLRAGESFAEAAYASGFADQSHFTRIFRNFVGLTPASWRASALF